MAERTSRSAVLIAVLGVLGATLTCLTAYFGLMSSRANAERDAAQASASALSSSVDDLEADLSAQAQQPAPVVPTPTTTAGAPVQRAAATIRHEGDLDITASSDSADLDAPASDPQWGRYSDSVSPEFLRLQSNGVNTMIGLTAAVQAGGSADYATCSTETAYEADQFGTDNLVPGTVWCVHTSEDRFGSVTVTAFDGDVLSLHVVIWQD